MSIFKACDVRGIYPSEISEETAYRIGRAIATIIDGGTVVVGGDVRLSTPSLKTAIIDGLTASGCDAIDLGTLPTPAFYFAKKMLGVEAGVMVTASHNPAEYNGLKVALGNLPITEREILRIRSMIETNGFLCCRGRVVRRDVLSDYEDHISALGAGIMRGAERLPRVVADCGNGCFSEIAPRVLERLQVSVAPLFCEVDGSFPNRSPNSAVAENLGALREAVLREKADMGVAFDGDGDRVSFVDEKGNMLTADQAIAIVAACRNGGIDAGERVVLDIKCSAAVSEVISRRGAVPLMEKSGHTFIKTRMIRENAALGGEISGHLFYRELGGGDDGLYSALVMVGIVAKHGSLARLAAAVPSYATTPDLRIRVEPDPEILDRIAAAFPAERVTRLDGVRVSFPDGWGLARLSVTEPLITLRFEGRDEGTLREIMEEFLAPVPHLRRRVLGGE